MEPISRLRTAGKDKLLLAKRGTFTIPVLHAWPSRHWHWLWYWHWHWHWLCLCLCLGLCFWLYWGSSHSSYGCSAVVEGTSCKQLPIRRPSELLLVIRDHPTNMCMYMYMYSFKSPCRTQWPLRCGHLLRTELSPWPPATMVHFNKHQVESGPRVKVPAATARSLERVGLVGRVAPRYLAWPL